MSPKRKGRAMADLASIGTLESLAKIIVSDLVLSGDNAVVIGLAVQGLRQPLRRRAILWGTVGAIVLRVIFTIFATFLLKVPLLSALGGFALLWIGWKLLSQVEESVDEAHEVRGGFIDAIRTIIIADAVMSLDNALAVAGAARGEIVLLLIGLALSIPLLMVGANVISSLMNRFAWLPLIGAALIAWVGADLIHEDKLLQGVLPFLETGTAQWILRIVAVAGVIVVGLWSKRQALAKELAENAREEIAREEMVRRSKP
jgi:YjbE family integral membrane protein